MQWSKLKHERDHAAYTPQKNITRCLLRRLPTLSGYITLWLAVNMAMFKKSSTVSKNKVHAAFDITISQILSSIMQIQGILHKQTKNVFSWSIHALRPWKNFRQLRKCSNCSILGWLRSMTDIFAGDVPGLYHMDSLKWKTERLSDMNFNHFGPWLKHHFLTKYYSLLVLPERKEIWDNLKARNPKIVFQQFNPHVAMALA